ncbi:Sec-independent protein translocase protein TatB [Aureimonas psammosilenae]|uniref:Sec-independent protein translocase protein TatB n=1 Tax=Aureimonas psammosilenae TaxID=2495496 RepID=UPI001260FBA2|nr:Sec-independent protein translocase protein TatB [Aureimonas psammosilenae]
MFEVGWSELLVIGVVLIVVVGPKDLPRMLRTFGRVTSQLRRMAGDFRRQFDDALREAEMDDVKETVRDIGRMDPRNSVRDALNPIRAVGDEIRSSLRAATKAPEPRLPTADAPATPAAPPPADVETASPAAAAPEADKTSAAPNAAPSKPDRELASDGERA